MLVWWRTHIGRKAYLEACKRSCDSATIVLLHWYFAFTFEGLGLPHSSLAMGSATLAMLVRWPSSHGLVAFEAQLLNNRWTGILISRCRINRHRLRVHIPPGSPRWIIRFLRSWFDNHGELEHYSLDLRVVVRMFGDCASSLICEKESRYHHEDICSYGVSNQSRIHRAWPRLSSAWPVRRQCQGPGHAVGKFHRFRRLDWVLLRLGPGSHASCLCSN